MSLLLYQGAGLPFQLLLSLSPLVDRAYIVPRWMSSYTSCGQNKEYVPPPLTATKHERAEMNGRLYEAEMGGKPLVLEWERNSIVAAARAQQGLILRDAVGRNNALFLQAIEEKQM